MKQAYHALQSRDKLTDFSFICHICLIAGRFQPAFPYLDTLSMEREDVVF